MNLLSKLWNRLLWEIGFDRPLVKPDLSGQLCSHCYDPTETHFSDGQCLFGVQQWEVRTPPKVVLVRFKLEKH